MPDPSALIAALIRARRSGDRAAVAAALTRLAECGYRLTLGSDLPPRRSPPSSTNPT